MFNYLYIYIYIHTYVYIYVCMYTHMYTHMYVYTWIYVWIYYIYTHVWIYVHAYIYVCIYVYTCMHVYNARPNQRFMFTAWLQDFRKLFYVSFSTNIQTLVQRIRCSSIWSSAHDYALLVLTLNPVNFLISTRCIWSEENILYQFNISSQRTARLCWPLNIFAWFKGRGDIHIYNLCLYTYINVHIFIYMYVYI